MIAPYSEGSLFRIIKNVFFFFFIQKEKPKGPYSQKNKGRYLKKKKKNRGITPKIGVLFRKENNFRSVIPKRVRFELVLGLGFRVRVRV